MFWYYGWLFDVNACMFKILYSTVLCSFLWSNAIKTKYGKQDGMKRNEFVCVNKSRSRYQNVAEHLLCMLHVRWLYSECFEKWFLAGLSGEGDWTRGCVLLYARLSDVLLSLCVLRSACVSGFIYCDAQRHMVSWGLNALAIFWLKLWSIFGSFFCYYGFVLQWINLAYWRSGSYLPFNHVLISLLVI